jgi:hypothetical protein
MMIMGYVYTAVGGMLVGGVLSYLYAKAVIVKIVNEEKNLVSMSESNFHNVLNRVKAAL